MGRLIHRLVKTYPDRPTATQTNNGVNGVGFDESLPPDNSWERKLDDNEFELDRLAVGYAEPSWIDEADFNFGALLRNVERKRIGRNRIEMVQPHEE
ncbi:hypothetical protein PC118_g22235 [Phytophthora cactorum]|uniref:Uncharacterized protein n=1 Tax=Phytophthora cactorum TaxID=29920 RepID=A0A8T1F3C9_9STRA|nr:hypothetical protein PC118_g22235 [Phytophthora cactorum]